MDALVKYGLVDGQVEIRQTDEPECPSDRVLIGVRAAGVCGSDVHLWRNHQSWEINLPLVLGHEFSGEVVAQVPVLNKIAHPSAKARGDPTVL